MASVSNCLINALLDFPAPSMRIFFISLVRHDAGKSKKMNILEIKTEVKVYDNASELGKEDQSLLKKAKEALQKAYAPYSKFQVGAALLLDDGTVVTGSNQENASFPLGLCAERIALAN